MSTGCRWSGISCYFADVSKIGQDTAERSAFCPLSRLVFGALSLNMVLFRVFRGFLGSFGRFVWVCVVLVLCVACVALNACGVRRLKGLLRVCLRFSCFSSSLTMFILFSSCMSFCPALFWLSFACPLVLSLWLFGCGCWCYFFPIG